MNTVKLDLAGDQIVESGLPPDSPLSRLAKNFSFTTYYDFVHYFAGNRISFFIDTHNTEQVNSLPVQCLNRRMQIPGIRPAKTLVIGKMPTRHESNSGITQIGPMGDNWLPFLQEKGVNLDETLMTYVVPYKVPEHISGKGALKVGLVKENISLLASTVKAVQPEVVLLMGADALKAFVRLYDPKMASKVKFTNLRGSVIEFPDGILGICCASASQVHRSPEDLPEMLRDLEIFANVVVSGQSKKRQAADIHVVDTFEKLDSYFDAINPEETTFALDMEWGAGETLRTIQLCNHDNYALVIHLTNAGLIPTKLGANLTRVYDRLRHYFDLYDVHICGHNVRGDLKILRSQGLDLMDHFAKDGGFDTMLTYHLIPGNETLAKRLEDCALRYLDTPRYDHELREWLDKNHKKSELSAVGYGLVPDEILLPYGGWDAIVTFELMVHLKKLLSGFPGIEDLYYNILHPLNWPILEMEETGVMVDMDVLLKLTDLFAEKRDELLDLLRAEINWREVTIVEGGETKLIRDGFNPNSPDQVKEILFGVFKTDSDGNLKRASPEDARIYNLTPVKSTTDKLWKEVMEEKKTHVYNPSTDGETLGMLADKCKFARIMKDYKVISQVSKNFLRPYELDDQGRYHFDKGLGGSIGTDGRLRTSFRTTLETGRYATSPNL